MDKTDLINKLYQALLDAYGPRGWWPLLTLAGRDGFDERGYHPGRYDYPRTEGQRFEVILGALLTQNTSWGNAEKRSASSRRRASSTAPALVAALRRSWRS